MTTTTATITCPNWCENAADPAGHDVETRTDGAYVVDHTVDFGPGVWGVVTQEVLTGGCTPAMVALSDVEAYQPGAPTTPERVRELAASLLRAGEWLEQHTEQPA
ncbi:MAG: hypothetical protein NTX33_05860 [Propionibacteriales bacterium]|nr:hypothetical protein [Propionibacteriales bacterium]